MADKKYTPREAAIQVLQKAEELYRVSSLSKAEIPLEKAKMDESLTSSAKVRARTQRNSRTETTTTPPSLMGKLMGKKPEVTKESSSAKHPGHVDTRRDDLSGHKVGGSPGSKVVGTPAATQHKMFVPSSKDRLAHKLTQVGKSEDQANPDAQADAQLGEKVEQDVQAHEAQNQDSAHHEKGSYKLAKFMGRREHKRSQKEMDKGEAKTGAEHAAEGSKRQSAIAQKEIAGNVGPRAGDLGASLAQKAAAPMAAPAAGHEQTLSQIHQMSKPKMGKGM